jgi:hypothetical protein
MARADPFEPRARRRCGRFFRLRAAIALAGIVVAAWLNRKNDKAGYWVNLEYARRERNDHLLARRDADRIPAGARVLCRGAVNDSGSK